MVNRERGDAEGHDEKAMEINNIGRVGGSSHNLFCSDTGSVHI